MKVNIGIFLSKSAAGTVCHDTHCRIERPLLCPVPSAFILLPADEKLLCVMELLYQVSWARERRILAGLIERFSSGDQRAAGQWIRNLQSVKENIVIIAGGIGIAPSVDADGKFAPDAVSSFVNHGCISRDFRAPPPS
jgi:hypothetical protein